MNKFSIWIMWFLGSIFYAYQYILRVLPNIMMPEIMEKFAIDTSVFGQFSGIYYLGYAGMHIPLGILLDRYGPKYVMPSCILLMVGGLLPILYTDLWVYPLIGRLLIGMGSSAAILSVFKIIRMGFEEERFTRMLGISVTIGLIGAIYGGQPVNYLLSTFGWETVLHIIAFVGIILAVTSFFIIPQLAEKPDQAQTNIWQDVKAVLSNPMVISVCLLSGLLVGPLEGFADVWGTEFLKKVYHLNDAKAAFLPSLIFLGMCFGAPGLSYLADKTKAYYGITILAALGMGISFTYILSGWATFSLMTVLFSIVGVLCAYQILVIYKASTYVSEKLVGLTTAVANMIIMTFGYVFHSSIGRIMDVYSGGHIAGDVQSYSGAAFSVGLSIIPITLAIGAFGFMVLALKEKKPSYAI